MKKLSIVVLTAAIVLFGFSFTVDTKDWKDIRDVTYGIGTATETFCTATKISETQLLTASHCVIEDQTVTVWDEDKVVGKALTVFKSPGKDLALLLITEGVEGEYASMASLEAPQDAIVVAAGYPLGIAEVLTEGVLQASEIIMWSDEYSTSFYITTAQVTFGNSGGGLFVYKPFTGWLLIGVGSGVAIQPPGVPYNNINFVVSLKEIKEFLELAKVDKVDIDPVEREGYPWNPGL